MKTKLSKKRGLSIVLTTVIILVASVVLGTGIVLYGSSLFQENTQIEGFKLSEIKLWVHTTEDVGISWGAVAIRNSGDKTISVHRISIRGVDVPFSQWYVDNTLTPTEFGKSLNHTGWANTDVTDGPIMLKVGECLGHTEYFCIDQDSSGTGTDIINGTAATGSVALDTGDTTIKKLSNYTQNLDLN